MGSGQRGWGVGVGSGLEVGEEVGGRLAGVVARAGLHPTRPIIATSASNHIFMMDDTFRRSLVAKSTHACPGCLTVELSGPA